MQPQSLKNHLRFYAPHHFVFYPLTSLLLGFSVYKSFSDENSLQWIFISIIIILMMWLSYMMRQHYALTLQDRIIRMEVRYRCFSLTGKHLEEFNTPFSDSQLFALRFASDAEFPELLERIYNENLSAPAIKAAIKNWKPDHHRV